MDTENDYSTTMNSSDPTATSPNLSGINFSSSFQFWFLLSFHVPSLICYCIVLKHILTQKSHRQVLHNHSIIVLLFIALCVVLFDYSWLLDCLRRGEVYPQTPAFCKVWWMFDYGLYNACTVVLAWASFERHILIFHSHLIVTTRRRILLHYLPLIGILIYLAAFYTYAIYFLRVTMNMTIHRRHVELIHVIWALTCWACGIALGMELQLLFLLQSSMSVYW